MDRTTPAHRFIDRTELVADLGSRLRELRQPQQVGVLFCRLDWLSSERVPVPGDDREPLAAMIGRFRSLVRDEDSVDWLDDHRIVVATSEVATERDLRAVADRLLEATMQPLRFRDGSSRLVSLSIGVAATLLDSSATAKALLAGAEAASAQARRDGGDRYVLFDAEVRARLHARLELASELRLALDRGSLDVHYQPVVDLATGAVDELEALVRWPHPVRGMIHPASFLPVAAETGMLVEIGEQVIARACQQAQAWTTAAGRTVSVSVNVGIEELLGSDLVAIVERALGGSGLPAGQLRIEVAERLVLDGGQHGPISLVLRRLAPTGVGVVVDHSAGGPDSFRRLEGLPMVSTLKLDPLLVQGLSDGSVDPATVRSVAQRAAEAGVAAIATGVEHPEQLVVLRQAGITAGQGFALWRPSSAEHLEAVVTTGCPIPAPAEVEGSEGGPPDPTSPSVGLAAQLPGAQLPGAGLSSRDR